MYEPAPAVLYKYLPIDLAWLPGLLEGKSLLFSARASFNDPLDSRPAYQLKLDSSAGSEFAKEKLRSAGMKPAERVLAMSHLRRLSHKPRPFAFVGTNQDPLDSIGILCLAERWDSMLLWSHYASMHSGICVGFHSDRDIFRIASRVYYSDELPVINRPEDDADAMLQKAFFTKARCWAYENEWRIVLRNLNSAEQAARYSELLADLGEEDAKLFSQERGPGIYAFNTAAIESLTLGCKVSANVQREVLTLASQITPAIPVYRIDVPKVSFELSRRTLRPGSGKRG